MVTPQYLVNFKPNSPDVLLTKKEAETLFLQLKEIFEPSLTTPVPFKINKDNIYYDGSHIVPNLPFTEKVAD